MTRSSSGELAEFDPEIDRTFHRLRKENQIAASLEEVLQDRVDIPQDKDLEEKKEEDLPVDPALPQLLVVDAQMAGRGAPVRRTLRELANPTFQEQPLCIEFPTGDEETDFELKSGVIHHLPKFSGLRGDDPNKHLKEFHVICATMKPQKVNGDAFRLVAFPFSLTEVAREWLFSLPSGSITTWDQMQKKFLEKYFPAQKATFIRKEICGIRQNNNENAHDYWERFKRLLSSSCDHGIPTERLIEYFVDGMLPIDKKMLDAAAGGSIMNKYPEDAWDLIGEMAENAREFEIQTRRVSQVETSRSRQDEGIRVLKAMMQKLLNKSETPQVVKACEICK